MSIQSSAGFDEDWKSWKNESLECDIDSEAEIEPEIWAEPPGTLAQVDSPLAPVDFSLGPPSGNECWVRSVANTLGLVLCERLHEISQCCGGELTYGSDCSGVDAPAIAVKSVIKHLQPMMEDCRI